MESLRAFGEQIRKTMDNCREGKKGQPLPVPESMSNQVEPYPIATQRAVSRPPQARSARIPLRCRNEVMSLTRVCFTTALTNEQPHHFWYLLPNGPRKEGHRRISRKLWMDGENAGTRVRSKDPSTFFLVWLPLRVDS
jgi:hypothetical protein